MINDSLWLDEATTALVAQMSWRDMFTNFLPFDFHPPAYYFLMKFWVGVFGVSEISLRIPSVIFAALTVYLIYKIAGKLSALLLSVNPLFFYYAQEARMYMMITFLVTYLVYLFKRDKWFLFSVMLAVLGLTDYVALFIIPVFLIIIKNKKPFILSLVPLLMSYLWWGSYFISQFKGGLSVINSSWGQILGPATFKNFALIPVKFLIGRVSFDNKYLYVFIVVCVIGLFTYILYKAKSAPKIYWYWLTLPMFIGFLVSYKIPTLTYFRFIFCLPALYILISYGLNKLGKYKNYFATAIIAISVVFTSYFILTPQFHKEDWRLAANTIGDNQIVTPTIGQREALVYYGKKNQIVESPNAQTVWLSRYVWEVFDPNDSTRLKIEDMGYNKISEYSFNGVLFFKYENRN